MRYFYKKIQSLKKLSEIGFFLSFRQIKRGGFATTILIVFVMTLTFLNLVVVSGILVGLIQGAIDAVKEKYMGDVIITALKEKEYVENSPTIIKTAENLPWVSSISPRYIVSGVIESNYKTRVKQTDIIENAGVQVAGINPDFENKTTNISKYIIEGSFINKNDYGEVVLGAMLLKKYLAIDSGTFPVLGDVKIGDKVRIKIGKDISREVTVKGIVKTKVDELDRRVFFVDSELRNMVGRNDYSVNEISIKGRQDSDAVLIKNALVSYGFEKDAKIQTFEEGMPKFILDMKNTFNILGTLIGSIGLVVASITIFIVIYINAITRRKFIGILKGIGISSHAIETAYVFQSIFYAFMGIIIGFIILFGFLQPYIYAHPINFPFSDGILVATFWGTAIRAGLLMLATIIAGFIPAKIVVKQNTLDAILGR